MVLGFTPKDHCAVLRHQGSHANIEHCVYYPYREWLPNSQENLRDYPCFFQYLNAIHEIDECHLEADIYLPLR